MGIVRFALKFPYTFYTLAALILFLGVSAIGNYGDSALNWPDSPSQAPYRAASPVSSPPIANPFRLTRSSRFLPVWPNADRR
jgi:hypothetical protein